MRVLSIEVMCGSDVCGQISDDEMFIFMNDVNFYKKRMLYPLSGWGC